MPQYAATPGRPQPPDDDVDGERAPVLRPLDPRVRQLWWAQAALVAVGASVLALVVGLLAPLPFPAALLTVTVPVLAVGAGVLLPVVRYRRWRYALREEDLWVRHGVWSVVTTAVPLARLQFVDTQQGPLDRAFGLAQLVVHTAASGTTIRLPGLDERDASRLRDRLAAAAPGGAGV